MFGATLTATIGIAALAAMFGGWIRGPLGVTARVCLGASGLLLLHGSPGSSIVGLVWLGLVLILHYWGHPRRIAGGSPP